MTHSTEPIKMPLKVKSCVLSSNLRLTVVRSYHSLIILSDDYFVPGALFLRLGHLAARGGRGVCRVRRACARQRQMKGGPVLRHGCCVAFGFE